MKRLKNRGFTLVELIVVVGILGVLIAVIAPSTKGSSDEAVSRQMTKVARDIVTNWRMATTACGYSFSADVVGLAINPVDLSKLGAAGLLDPAKDLECYKASGAGLVDGIRTEEPLPGSESYLGPYVLSVYGAGTTADPIRVAYYDVPDKIVLKMVNGFEKLDALGPDAGGFDPADSATWSKPYAYDAENGAGGRSFYFLYR